MIEARTEDVDVVGIQQDAPSGPARRLRPYPAYKPSGVSWLGEIPTHWHSTILRRAATVQASNVDKHVVEGEIPVSLCNYTDVYYNNYISHGMDFSKGSATAEELQRFRLLAGDVLITKDSESWDDIAVPAVVLDTFDEVVCGYHLSQIRPGPELDGRYLRHWIGSHEGAIHFKVSANGVTRFGLSANAIKSASLPLPPLDEQGGIADFLDAMDERVNRFIDVRRRMIELLEEQKQATITQAVTKGVYPDVPMKPSGIDWLADIPAHWDVRRIKSLARETDSRTQAGTEELLSLRMREGLVPHNLVSDRMIEPDALVGYKHVAPSQLVMNRMRASVGLFAVSDSDGLVSPDYAVFDLSGDVNADYAVRLFKTPLMGAEFRRRSTGLGTGDSGFLRLYTDDFGTVRIPFPPLEEQASIVAHIVSALGEIAKIDLRYQQEIALIQEYRTRLTSDVVTGKLDVRTVDLRPATRTN